jgi:hypothetical protein
MAGAVRSRERIRLSVYDPISFVAFLGYPHDLPAYIYHKCLPLFAWKFGVLADDHLVDLLKVVDDCDVEHAYVVMRMSVQTLEGDEQTWYISLPDVSIDG